MIEEGISEQLRELGCTAEMLFEYASRYGGDPRADRLLARLLALSDFHAFCEMMQQAHAMGPVAA
eukprot:5927643-Prymnesium_polylepis.1